MARLESHMAKETSVASYKLRRYTHGHHVAIILTKFYSLYTLFVLYGIQAQCLTTA